MGEFVLEWFMETFGWERENYQIVMKFWTLPLEEIYSGLKRIGLEGLPEWDDNFTNWFGEFLIRELKNFESLRNLKASNFVRLVKYIRDVLGMSVEEFDLYLRFL